MNKILNRPVKNQIVKDQISLLKWYLANKRDLPWRNSRDPYRIWISEVMLQQTTVAAVRPFYQKFISRFPNVETLAQSTLEDVYEYWAGLGYYSRARNLHKSAKAIATMASGFPQKSVELIELPGFGPYTSHAVASLAFSERVGVLDGNVIRILCRKYGFDFVWWDSLGKATLQSIAHDFADIENSQDINQAMMELGAVICTPKKPLCALCPWNKGCASFNDGKVFDRPMPKPKTEFETWHLSFFAEIKNNKISVSANQSIPFLKNQLFPFIVAKKVKKRPVKFDFRHSVTKYDIFVSVFKMQKFPRLRSRAMKTAKWVTLEKISQTNPTSLMKKIVSHLQ